jgi:undecaprenyl-diphosphatase
LNYRIFQWIHDLAGHYSWLDSLMIVLANDIIYVMFALLVVLWLSGREGNQRLVFYACLSASVALLVASQVISPLVHHPRPFMDHAFQPLIKHSSDPSFPSDHATFAFSLTFIVWWGKRRLGNVMLLLALITGFARIYVGVHYPADILGGALMALVSSGLIINLSVKLDPVPSFFSKIYRKLTSKLPFLPRPL